MAAKVPPRSRTSTYRGGTALKGLIMNIGEQAEQVLKIVAEAPLIAYDTETSGLDWHKNFPVGYVVTADKGNNFYIPIRHGGGGNLLDPDGGTPAPPDSPTQQNLIIHTFERELARAFAERTRRGYRTITHNGKFDAHMSLRVGVSIGRNLYDTGITQALLNEYTRKWTLEEIAKEHGVTPKLSEPLYEYLASRFGGDAKKGQMENFWQLHGRDEMGVDYAMGDGITTLELHHKQMGEIEKQQLMFIHELESDLIWTLVRMEQRGVKVDLQYCEWLDEYIEGQIKIAASALPDGFNSRSGPQVQNLMASIGRLDWPVTDKGNPSFTEHWLKTFDEGKAILRHRQWNNIRNTFLNPLTQEHVYNGRVHPSINQLKGDEYGTVSGRFSCSRPNLQQLPKRNEEVAIPFRKVFVADSRFKFYERDYSQCEPRLFAHYSKEPSLVAGYLADPPRDMHQVVAELLNVERDPTAKRMNMGILTGMYPKAFAGHMGWDLEMAQNKWNEWFEVFPGIRSFQGQATDVFKSRGYIRTLLGRRCRLDKPRFAYRGTSRIIQGGNADILKYKLLQVDLYLESVEDRSQMLMTVHDSFNYQCPDDDNGQKDHEEIGRIMEDVMTDPIRLSIPFVTDSGSGDNWSQASFGDKAL